MEQTEKHAFASINAICAVAESLVESDDPAKRSQGLALLLQVSHTGNSEAVYLVGRYILSGLLRSATKDNEEAALTLLCQAARSGNLRARALLNSYCAGRLHTPGDQKKPEPGPLRDFYGKIIEIDRKGVFTPIDARLSYADGKNTLKISANLLFLDNTLSDQATFRRAVIDGITEWQGEYKVFGNQDLRVETELTVDTHVFDSVCVIPITDMTARQIEKAGNVFWTKNVKKRMHGTFRDKRSFAISGLKWSVRSRKFIYVQIPGDRFDDHEQIKHVAKHEFGHALGLGDLYRDEGLGLAGVQKGSYCELDGYFISDRVYNLVMCDHYGPISNNDIEMVVLAFRENREQLYQPCNFKGKISDALGKGN